MLVRAIAAINARLLDDWKTVVVKAWSVRLALFWGALSGLYLAWPALSSFMPMQAYVAGSMVIAAAIGVARLTKQAGVSD